MIDIRIGDVFARLAELPDDHFDCVVTSPPYWGLRDYGVAGQIGLEPTLGEHLDVMVSVFREVRRVLKPSGTLWLNYGDCYATAPNGRSAAAGKALGADDRTFRDKPFSTVGPIYQPQPNAQKGRAGRSGNLGNGGINGQCVPDGRVVAGGALKPKDLCMVPNRLAIALQEDGWWIRSEIIWAKPNPMPESIIDRPGTAHEKIFMLTKSGRPTVWRARDTSEWAFAKPDLSERVATPTTKNPDATVNRWRAMDYFYDAEAVVVAASPATHPRISQDLALQRGSIRANGGSRSDRPMKAVGRGKIPAGWDTSSDASGHGSIHVDGRLDKQSQTGDPRYAGFNERWREGKGRKVADAGGVRANESFQVAVSGEVLETRNLRNYEPEPSRRNSFAWGRNLRNYEPAPVDVWRMGTRPFSEAHFATFPAELVERCLAAGCPPGGRVLDPFGGSGTTALVADRSGRDATLIELNEAYVDIARRRLTEDAGMFADITIEGPTA